MYLCAKWKQLELGWRLYWVVSKNKLLNRYTMSDSSYSDDNAAVVYVRRNIRRINFDVHDKYLVERFDLL